MSTRIYGIGRHEDDFIQFELDKNKILNDFDEFVRVIKSIEAMVRSDDRYKSYISKLRSSGYDQCAILGDLVKKGGDKIKLEMHHGPCLNLFDICSIVLRACLIRGKPESLTTFDVADIVLTEHELDNIQVVFLSKTAHDGNHKADIFIDIKATVGRIDRFIERWIDGMDEDHWSYIERYLVQCERANHLTTDQNLFDTAEKLKSFKE